jgi:hypothetical protein
MVRFDVYKLALLLLLAAPAAHAQLWKGPSAVEVRTEDQKGHDLAGAQVKVVYTSQMPNDGPPPVATDARGHANVSGLADGAWHVEVSHDGFMTYMVDIHVRQGGRPEIGDATQYRVPNGGTSLMKVKITHGTSAPSPSRAAAPVRPATPPPAPAPAPAPMAAPEQAPPPARVEAPPAPQPTPTPQPMPQPTPEVQPAPQPMPQPTPEVQPAPQLAPPPVTPRPVTPPPAPTPAPVAPPPAPVPAPTPPATPQVQAPESVRLRTAEDRTCVECQPGESALSTEKVIPTGGGPGCGGDIATKLQGGTVPDGLPAGCSVLRIALPAGARYTAYRYEVQDGKDSLDCPTAQDCPNGAGRFPMDPVLLRDPRGTIILAPFESGPAGRERRAVLTVYFTAGKK